MSSHPIAKAGAKLKFPAEMHPNDEDGSPRKASTHVPKGHYT